MVPARSREANKDEYMNESGAYGQRLADAFHVGDAPCFVSRSLRTTEIAVTEMRRDRPSHRLTEPVPCEDGFLLTLQIRDWRKRIRIARNSKRL